jgi:hypothetical protein
MREGQAFDLLVEMNPVPHPETEQSVSSLDERSGDMQVVQRMEPIETRQPPDRRGWIAAAAAAAVAVVFGGIWLLGFVGESEFTGGETPLARETEELLAAFNAGDYAAFSSAFEQQATLGAVNGWRFFTAAVTEAPSTAPADFGFQLTGNCVEQRPRVVRCTLSQRGEVFDRIGVTIPGTATVFYREDGFIYAVNMDSTLQVDSIALLDEWANWLRLNHPDVFAATFDASVDEAVPPNGVDTVDNRAQWTRLVGEYLEQRSQG